MKAVMISIRPEWVAKILSGEKTVEVRKTIPKLKPPFKCYIYCTKEKPGRKHQYEAFGINGKPVQCGGYVVAEFVCDRIDEYTNYSLDEQRGHTERREKLLRSACMTLRDWRDYIGNYRSDFGYAWHIFKLKIYDKPKQVTDFSVIRNIPVEYAYGTARQRYTLERPPQSWCYVEELR